jgi:hypothetical protein
MLKKWKKLKNLHVLNKGMKIKKDLFLFFNFFIPFF